MQALVTICLFDRYPAHGKIEEHLKEYLNTGWRIQSVSTVHGGDGGWIVVLLERDKA